MVAGQRSGGMIRRLYARFARLIHEVGKFGVVGAICYGIDFAIFNLLLLAYDEPFSAKTIATVIATTVAFMGNRYWTWRDRESTGLRREYLLYFFFNGVGLAITLGCIGINAWLGGFWPGIFDTKIAINVAANLVGVGLASLFRFWSYRRFVFKPAPAEG
jgi:putative flippase GtrA